MEYLAEFYGSQDVLENEDYSFAHFKTLWKKKRLDHIWLLKHPQEPQDMFYNELSTYVVDRILEEYQLKPECRRLSILVVCTYGLAVLYQTQPVIKLPEIKFPSFHAAAIEKRRQHKIPEYCFDAILFTVEALKDESGSASSTSEAYSTIQWLLETNALGFCLERPVRYQPGGKSPYPKERHNQVFTNGTHSRNILDAPNQIMDEATQSKLEKLSRDYQARLEDFHDGRQIPDTSEKFTQDLSKCRTEFSKWREAVKNKRSRPKFKYLNQFKLGIRPASTLIKPVDPEIQAEFIKACERYEKVQKGETVSDIEEPVVGTVLDKKKKKKRRVKEEPAELNARTGRRKRAQKKAGKKRKSSPVARPKPKRTKKKKAPVLKDEPDEKPTKEFKAPALSKDDINASEKSFLTLLNKNF